MYKPVISQKLLSPLIEKIHVKESSLISLCREIANRIPISQIDTVLLYESEILPKLNSLVRLGSLSQEDFKETWIDNEGSPEPILKANSLETILYKQLNFAFLWLFSNSFSSCKGFKSFNATEVLTKKEADNIRKIFLHKYLTSDPESLIEYLQSTFSNLAIGVYLQNREAPLVIKSRQLKLLETLLYFVLQNAIKFNCGGTVGCCLIEGDSDFQFRIRNNFDSEMVINKREGRIELKIVRSMLKAIHPKASLMTSIAENNTFEAVLTLPKSILI